MFHMNLTENLKMLRNNSKNSIELKKKDNSWCNKKYAGR